MERMTQRMKKNSPRKFLTKLLFICLGLVIIFIILIYSGRLNNVIVEGSIHYTEDELKKQLMTATTDKISVLFFLRNKFTKEKEIPFIQSMDIALVDKNTVKIRVYEKIVIGCVDLMGSYMYFDKDGIIVESSNERLENIPLITGLKYNQVILHKKLEVQKSSLFDTILNITKLVLLHELQVQTVQFNSSLEITLECDGNIVLLGKRDAYDEQIAALKELLVSSENKKYSFDMRNYSKNKTTVVAKPLNSAN